MVRPFRVTYGRSLLGILSWPLLGIVAFAGLLSAQPARADTLKITSTPPGATVEIDGVVVGKTPYEMKVPGSYLHRPATVLNSRRGHAMRLRISLKGYGSKEIVMTDGPMEWVALNGRKAGDYWLLKTDHFDVALEPESNKSLTGTVVATGTGNSRVELRSELSTEDVVAKSEPAVVRLETPEVQGSGFFITDTGVIASNAHVVQDEGAMTAILPDGRRAEAKVIYVDADRDLALLKVDGSDLPHLSLADLSTVRQGQTVVAIGNPAGLPFSVTKGIISAVGPVRDKHGTWIQTDTAINPGNSGGPLLNTYGEVVGVNTWKIVKDGGTDIQSINFALSSSDLLDVLHRFYPAASAPAAPNAAPAGVPGVTGDGSVAISSDPDGAEVYLDGKFVGNAPETLKLPTGQHTIQLKAAGRTDWQRPIEILKDSQLNLKAQLILK